MCVRLCVCLQYLYYPRWNNQVIRYEDHNLPIHLFIQQKHQLNRQEANTHTPIYTEYLPFLLPLLLWCAVLHIIVTLCIFRCWYMVLKWWQATASPTNTYRIHLYFLVFFLVDARAKWHGQNDLHSFILTMENIRRRRAGDSVALNNNGRPRVENSLLFCCLSVDLCVCASACGWWVGFSAD